MSKNDNLRFPNKLVTPIKEVLEKELMKTKKTEKTIKRSDPFRDAGRTTENSDEEDADEQMGHFDTEVKVNFLQKQIVQLRKALTRIKLGKYGICEKCGKMIDTDRLAVGPQITVCIQCEREREE